MPRPKRNNPGGSLMRLSATVLALSLLSPLAALAQTPPPPAAATPPPGAPPAAPPPPAAPAAPPAKTWKDLVTFDGLVDAYYMLNLNGANSLSAPVGRNFDTNSNTFTLNYAKLGIGVSGDNVGIRMHLGSGATAIA